MQILVLGVNRYTRKDGTPVARLTVASVPRSQNYLGLLPAEFDVLPEVADTMKVFPAIYDLELELPVLSGYGGRPNEVRPLVVAASFVAELIPAPKEVKKGAASS